jgi:hypothetical protein
MYLSHYRAAIAFVASLSLAVSACNPPPPVEQPAAQPGPTIAQQAAAEAPSELGEIDTESTIWTMLGLAKKQSEIDRHPGPKTGKKVNPVIYQAALDTLDFVKFVSEDPLGGSLITEWYSPAGKPDERYKITVFILDRALRSDSLSVTVDRQARGANGQWAETTIARQVETDLETAILRRARQLKQAWSVPAK